MKRHIYIGILGACALALVFAIGASGQDNNRPPDGQPSDAQQPQPGQQDVRGNLLRQLGLSREQIQQIRRMNAERGPAMKEAQRRFREANHALDAAIYADEVNEAEVQARLKDVQIAQAEMQRLRYMNELAVRRVLTPDQLLRFRELRERFEQARENFENRRPFRNSQPMGRPGAANDLRQPLSDQPAPRPAVRQVQPKPDQ